MNEYFNFQNHCVNLGLTAEEITHAWECLDVIRTKDIHPGSIKDKDGKPVYTLDIIQTALEWHEGFETDMSYIEKFLEL